MLLSDCKNIIYRDIENELMKDKLGLLFDYFNNEDEITMEQNGGSYIIVQNNDKLLMELSDIGLKALVDVRKEDRIVEELLIYKEGNKTIVLINTSNSREDGEFISNEVKAQKIVYNEYDVAMLSEYKKYLPGSLEGKIDINELLEVPRMAFEIGFWQGKYDLYKRIERKYYDVALFTIYGNHKKIFNGMIPLNNLNYQELVIDVFMYKELDYIEIDPWEEDEMSALLGRYEGKVKEGLMKLTEGRTSFSYRSNKDDNYYYDKDVSIDFIKG